jgi:hypothetical protein
MFFAHFTLAELPLELTALAVGLIVGMSLGLRLARRSPGTGGRARSR